MDTANLESIQKYLELGIVDGITTNPTLLFKENSDPVDAMKKIVKLVDGPVSLEVVATEGLKAVNALTKKNIKTNVTLIFSANQALLASKAGAAYVSPFIGRLDDIGHDGLTLISDIVQIFASYDISTQVLVASVRHPIHVIESAKLGADVVTLPPEILQKMIHHSLTDKGLDAFLADWEKVKKGFPNLQF